MTPILHGRTPYQDVDGIGHYLGYVYPPLLAFAIIPLSILPASVAASIWALMTFGFVAWSLWLLGVRDWRCYPVALLWPFTREAVEFGAIGPLLLLIVAFLWRYRDSTWGAATATASAVAAKLFLWPLALWLAFTGRIRTAGLSIAVTLVLVFVPWIAIGLAGLRQYPALLQEVADQQDYRSYSIIALVRSLGGSSELAKVLSLLLGVALLALAFRAARNRATSLATAIASRSATCSPLRSSSRRSSGPTTSSCSSPRSRWRDHDCRRCGCSCSLRRSCTHSTGTGRPRKASGGRLSSSRCSSRSSSSDRSGRAARNRSRSRLARVALTGKRIVVTGGAGFIGTTLARRLVDENEIVAVDNLHRDTLGGTTLGDHPNFSFVQGDVLDADQLAEVLAGATHVVHCAGIAGVDTVLESPVRTMRVNVIGTYNVLEAALRTQDTLERLVDFSTSEVFGQHAFNVHEAHVTTIGSVGEARWTYAVSKLAGEHMAHAYHSELGLPTTSVRPFNVFGPGQIGGGAIRAFIEAALAGRDLAIHGDGSQIRAWCYVDDMVDGALLALEHSNAVGESFNIGNARSAVTIHDLAQRVKRLTGCPGEIVFQPLHYTDVELRIPNIDKARELLGFEAKVDLDEGLERTIAWYRERSDR